MEKIVRSRSEDGTVFSVVPPSHDQELVGAATNQAPNKEMQYLRKQNFEQASVVAALRDQIVALEEDKMKILKTLRSERLIRKEAQKELKEQDMKNLDLQTPSNQQKDSNQHNAELAAENAALKRQIAAKEVEKNKIMMAQRATMIEAQMDLQNMEQEKQKVIDSLRQSLLEKQNEIVTIEQRWTECEKACEAWKEENREIRETCERKLQSALDQHNLMVKSLQDESDRKVSQVILEKDDMITQMTTAKMALEAEWTTKLAALQDQSLKYKVQLREKEMQLLQSEAECSIKLDALEDQSLKYKAGLKEKEMQLLQSQAEWSTLEDQIGTRLQAQVLRLKELNQKLKLGALMNTAEVMRAKKKELKKLIVEKEKEEKREKKEREEREKREKKEREESEKEESKRVRRERRQDRNRRWWT